MQGSLVLLESLAQQNLPNGSFIHRIIIVATLKHCGVKFLPLLWSHLCMCVCGIIHKAASAHLSHSVVTHTSCHTECTWYFSQVLELLTALKF